MKKRGLIIGLVVLLLISLLSITAAGRKGWRLLNGGYDLNGLPAIYEDYPLNVSFLDTGKSDAIIISCEGKHALIDAGTHADGEEVLVWLEKLGITQLSYVFCTHPDNDHIGGIPQVLDRVEAEHIILPDIPDALIPSGYEYRLFKDSLKGHSVTTVLPPTRFKLGTADIDVLGPIGNHQDINNYSLVLKLSYGGVDMLFSGDMEQRAEQKMMDAGIDLSADVLKVAHHGSNSSSSEKFLKAVAADIAVITAGQGSYNLQNSQAQKRLEDNGMKIYRTDLDGTVVVSTDGRNIKVTTQGETE